MEKQTMAQIALQLLSPIPSENFISGKFTNEIDKCCIIGHWTRLTSKNPNDYSSTNCIDVLIPKKEKRKRNLRKHLEPILGDISLINNYTGFSSKDDVDSPLTFNQQTPKDRSIAALKYAIKKGY
jgi:hypothetical protein